MSGSRPQRVLIVGGGLAGLAAGVRLRELGVEVKLLERGPAAGGVVTTKVQEGWRAELGPNSVAAVPPEAYALLERVGVTARMVHASPTAKHRFILRGGKPVALPASPTDLLATQALSGAAKLRLLKEPFIPPAPPTARETVADFARRRLGDEALDYLVNPFVAGVYAGDPTRLSLRDAFPKLHALELEHGSLIKGLAKSARSRSGDAAVPGGIWSLPEGLGGVPAAMAARLEGAIVPDAAVTAIRPRAGGGWRVAATVSGAPAEEAADAVLYAAPAHAWPAIAAQSPELADLLAPLGELVHPPVAVVALGFRRAQVAHPLDGFGLLVPEVERRRVLGVLFPSSLFAGRAPEGHVLLTAFVGGMRQPELARLEPAELEHLVRDELRDLLGVEGAQTAGFLARWPQAIPQYGLDYPRVREAITAAEARHPTLTFAGTFRDGISVGDALSSGLRAAERLAGPDVTRS